jgi:hypothetical protein
MRKLMVNSAPSLPSGGVRSRSFPKIPESDTTRVTDLEEICSTSASTEARSRADQRLHRELDHGLQVSVADRVRQASRVALGFARAGCSAGRSRRWVNGSG